MLAIYNGGRQYDIYMNGLLQIVNSALTYQGSLTLVTILAAFIVWSLYGKQRRDQRRDAAKIIIREIEQAESRIPSAIKYVKAIRGSGSSEKIRIMEVDSWNIAQYQLAGQLPEDVMKRIDDFYGACRLLDGALSHIDDAALKNEEAVRQNAFRMNASYLAQAVGKQKLNPESLASVTDANAIVSKAIEERRSTFNRQFPTLYSYLAVKALNDADLYLTKLPTDLSQTRVGQKLRAVSKGYVKRWLSRLAD
jgi:hypothetical protein